MFEIYDSYAQGRINNGGGGIVGGMAGNKTIDSKDKLSDIEENKIQNSIIYI